MKRCMDVREMVGAELLEVISGGHKSKERTGVHVSDLIAGIQNQISPLGKRQNAKSENKGIGPTEPLVEGEEQSSPSMYFAVGLAWERHLFVGLKTLRPGLIFEQLEVGLDDIIGTVDGYDIEHGIVIETKATYKSINSYKVEDNWAWLAQVKSYCKMLETNIAHFYVLYVCGDYKYPRPMSRFIELVFTPQEIAENWQLLTNYRDSILSGGK